jgi:hypothetical protein
MIGGLVVIDVFAAAILDFFAAAMDFFEVNIEICKLINLFIIIILTAPILSLNAAILKLM